MHRAEVANEQLSLLSAGHDWSCDGTENKFGSNAAAEYSSKTYYLARRNMPTARLDSKPNPSNTLTGKEQSMDRREERFLRAVEQDLRGSAHEKCTLRRPGVDLATDSVPNSQPRNRRSPEHTSTGWERK